MKILNYVLKKKKIAIKLNILIKNKVCFIWGVLSLIVSIRNNFYNSFTDLQIIFSQKIFTVFKFFKWY